MTIVMLTLSGTEARRLQRLLGTFQGLLESAIEASLVSGETEPREEIDVPNIKRDRRDWKAADQFVQRLEDVLGSRGMGTALERIAP
jgi:hypothetical protein